MGGFSALVVAYTRSWRHTGNFRIWFTFADEFDANNAIYDVTEPVTTVNARTPYTKIDATRSTQAVLASVELPLIPIEKGKVDMLMHVQNFECVYPIEPDPDIQFQPITLHPDLVREDGNYLHRVDYCYFRLSAYFKL
jgi:hypothetical protein